MSTSLDGDHPSSTSSGAVGDQVQLVVCAGSGLTSVIRVVGTGLAARLGFDVARVEDVRLALDELCLAMLDRAAPDSTLHFDFDFGADGSLGVRARLDPRPGEPPMLDPLARQVLSAVASFPVPEADDHAGGDGLGLRFERRGPSPDDGARGS